MLSNNPILNSLPRDRTTINSWVRTLYLLNPDVNRIIEQHIFTILSLYKFVEGKSKTLNESCKEHLFNLKITSILEEIIREYFIIGEVFLLFNKIDLKNKWDIIIQNPDYLMVKREDASDKYFLRPDANIRRIVLSSHPTDIEKCKSISNELVALIRAGKNIPLDTNSMFIMMHKSSPYQVRGESYLLPLLNSYSMLTQLDNMDEQFGKMVKNVLFDISSFDNKDIINMVVNEKYKHIGFDLTLLVNDKILAPFIIASFPKIPAKNYPKVIFEFEKLIKTGK